MPQPAPAVPQVPAGWGPDQADMDYWVTDSFSFLAQPASFRAQLTSTEALSGGFLNLVEYNSVLEDPYSGWSAVTTGSQPAWSWLCPAGCAGWYEASLSGFCGNQGGTSDLTAAALYLNGTVWQYSSQDWAVSGGDSGTSGGVQVPLLPGDYVQVFLFVTASVSTPAVAGQYPGLELCWVSS